MMVQRIGESKDAYRRRLDREAAERRRRPGSDSGRSDVVVESGSWGDSSGDSGGSSGGDSGDGGDCG